MNIYTKNMSCKSSQNLLSNLILYDFDVPYFNNKITFFNNKIVDLSISNK